MDRRSGVLAQLQQVSKAYGAVQALDGVDLDVHAGQVLALLGPNGAGKSTAIGLLLGLQRADAGTARLFGRDPQDIAARRNIGVMLQQAALPETLRVRELIALAASYYPVPRTVRASADLAGVADLLGRPYAKLSGGQQRRVQFALATCGRPRLLFLDEPSAGMDVESRERMWAAIRTIVDEGTAVLLTTHYLEEAEALARRVCVLARGRVLSDGCIDALRARIALKRVWCATHLPLAELATWPDVALAAMDGARACLSTEQPERLVRELLARDPMLSGLEVRAAGLAEAFIDLTRDDGIATLREAA